MALSSLLKQEQKFCIPPPAQKEAQCAGTPSTAFTKLDSIFAPCFFVQNNDKIVT